MGCYLWFCQVYLWRWPSISPTKIYFSPFELSHISTTSSKILLCLPHESKGNVCVCELFSCVQLFVTPWTVNPPGSSVHGILQARILEWVAIPFSRGSPQLRDWTQASCIAGRFFLSEPPGKPRGNMWDNKNSLALIQGLSSILENLYTSYIFQKRKLSARKIKDNWRHSFIISMVIIIIICIITIGSFLKYSHPLIVFLL